MNVHVNIMEATLSGLRALHIDLELLEVDFKPVWRTVGGTLEELGSNFRSGTDQINSGSYNYLGINYELVWCGGIKKLKIENTPDDKQRDVAQVFKSYGDCNITLQNYQGIRDTCRPRAFRVYMTNGIAVDIFRAITVQIEYVRVDTLIRPDIGPDNFFSGYEPI